MGTCCWCCCGAQVIALWQNEYHERLDKRCGSHKADSSVTPDVVIERDVVNQEAESQ